MATIGSNLEDAALNHVVVIQGDNGELTELKTTLVGAYLRNKGAFSGYTQPYRPEQTAELVACSLYIVVVGMSNSSFPIFFCPLLTTRF